MITYAIVRHNLQSSMGETYVELINLLGEIDLRRAVGIGMDHVKSPFGVVLLTAEAEDVLALVGEVRLGR